MEGIVLGATYGLFIRLALQLKFNGEPLLIMTLGFLFFVPMAMGILSVSRAAKFGPVPWTVAVFAPWISVLFTFLGAILLYMEGAICAVFALPIAVAGATVGGVIGAFLSRSQDRVSTRASLCVAILPVLISSVETQLHAPIQTKVVASEIRIHASPGIIWANVERVRPIASSELPNTWTHRIGFPRPVEATLSFEGVGGVRHASFEHGLIFIETVKAWEPERRLAFSIKADTAHIPPTTLDEHVTIGGPYFDVLDGEYLLEPLAGGDTLLHLTSRERLSTDFNGYAGWWSDAVMQNLQTSILEVVRKRCEPQE